MKKIIFQLICSIWSLTNVYSQSNLTLDDCKALALKNNVDIKNARLDIENAQHAEKQAFSKYFATVNASGMAFTANKQLINAEIAPGMEIAVIKKGFIGGITATQPIFAGGQISNTNKLAALGVEIKNCQLKQSEDAVILNTEKYYWQCIQLEEKLNTILFIEKQIENIHKDVALSVKAGLTNRNDLLQIQLRKDEIASTKLQIENGLQLTKMLLGQHIGLKTDSFNLAKNIFEKLSSPDNHKTNHEAALKKTVAYSMLDKSITVSKIQTRIETGKYLPTLAIGASYMYNNLMFRNEPTAIVFTSVSIPISEWWGGSHAIKQKKAQERVAENNRQNINEQLLIQMQQTFNNLELKYKQVEISQKSIENAQENLRLSTDYYKGGTNSLSNLLDAQSLLQSARDNFVEKQTNYLIELSEYRRATSAYNK